MSAAAVARSTGLPRTTAHRMLCELARVGLLERVGTAFRPGLLRRCCPGGGCARRPNRCR
ncbi:helix-turn-helix domain-containing protein [Amycolatopsis methanolica]|uniref:helix-turn-helix domain-containing protein n=1 Tax=Amycolatopsis methanolica TaxID=1814 RepID=UPI00341CA3D2